MDMHLELCPSVEQVVDQPPVCTLRLASFQSIPDLIHMPKGSGQIYRLDQASMTSQVTASKPNEA